MPFPGEGAPTPSQLLREQQLEQLAAEIRGRLSSCEYAVREGAAFQARAQALGLQAASRRLALLAREVPRR